MDMALRKNKYKKFYIIIFVTLILIAAAVFCVIMYPHNSYRSIIVDQVKGVVNVTEQGSDCQAFKGQRLSGGNDVRVHEDSSLLMCMDTDKYVYADSNTHFLIDKTKDSESSRITLYLESGSLVNDIKTKLGPNDSYEVDTPNSVMSVRGTTFHVSVFEGEDGVTYTRLEVEEGEVISRLKGDISPGTRGDFFESQKRVSAGESCLIKGDDKLSEFVSETGG